MAERREKNGRGVWRAAALVSIALLSACGARPPETGINDPYEEQNRRVHEFNLSLDRNVLRPMSQTFAGSGEEMSVGEVLSNFSSNLGQPRRVLNNVLQGNAEDALANTMRFLVNSTFGFAGLLDPATDMGIYERDTDFGETLYVWGAAEGPYLVLPVIGPSTTRDAFGRVVDVVIDPLNLPDFDKSEGRALFVARVAGAASDRGRYGDTVDSILYDSADSYAQIRLLYLQNRRFELTGSVSDDAYDPYEDPYEDLDAR